MDFTMATQFDNETQLVLARNEKIKWEQKIIKWEQKISLLEQLVALEHKHGSEIEHNDFHVVATASASNAEAPRRRGRPRRIHAPDESSSPSKSMTLPSLLISIGSQHDRPLTIKEISELVDEAGYHSTAADPGYMIYQSLYKLCKKGIFERDREEGSYKFIGQEN